jgi:hypothetical protein
MSSAAICHPSRELARRISGGIEVTLYWNADDNSTSIDLWHPASRETFAFAVPRERALDAFYHPFAYVPMALDEPPPAPHTRRQP